MIADYQTNYLYLADCLPKKHPGFYKRFQSLLSENKIEFSLLPHTKDIWAVDYMPIQVTEDDFIQFIYNPGYLQTEPLLKTISNPDEICKAIDLKKSKSNILLDGGNVVKHTNKAIVSTRVFEENRTVADKSIIKQLAEDLKVDELIFVPSLSEDFTGHADGMVRFLDENTVLINDFSGENREFQYNFEIALHHAGLEFIAIPYNPFDNKKDYYANGIYINYLQMDGIIILPVYNMKEDDETVKLFESTFSNLTIRTIESNEIAREGGILNCITWNIKKPF